MKNWPFSNNLYSVAYSAFSKRPPVHWGGGELFQPNPKDVYPWMYQSTPFSSPAIPLGKALVTRRIVTWWTILRITGIYSIIFAKLLKREFINIQK